MTKDIQSLVSLRNTFNQTEDLTLEEYLSKAKKDASLYHSAAERLLKAIGEPTVIDTAKEPRMSRIFCNRTIRIYPAFKEFYGLEDVIDNIVSFLKHAAQGLEERKQILYLLGPVGGGKSSLAERLKKLMEKEPIYVLVHKGVVSPIHESPLGLFSSEDSAALGIPPQYLKGRISPWARKRLREDKGELTNFSVKKMYPSQADQLAIAKTEPGDENNQDISTLVGKVNMSKLHLFGQDDTDAYNFSGGLCKANQGLLEFVEMFKAPIKVLHPLLTATQEGNYNGTEAIPSIPFDGLILAHSNEAEWNKFKNNKNNEAFIDRIYIVKVPYCLRITEETEIYKKLLRESTLSNAPCTNQTLENLAKFAVLSRLKDHENSNEFSKMKVYDGENIKDQDKRAKSIQEYRDSAGVFEGFTGISTRFAFKVLSKTFNFDPTEIAANPIHLFYVLELQLKQEHLSEEVLQTYKTYLSKYLVPDYLKFVEKEIKTAYLESYSQFGQALFDRYITYADFWLQDQEFRDPETGQMMNMTLLAKELATIEKAAEISNPQEFRHEVVNFVLRVKANNGGKTVDWRSYTKLAEVIEHKMFNALEDVLPIIGSGIKPNKDDQKKHDEFVKRMTDKGYTEKQVKLICDWYIKQKKSS